MMLAWLLITLTIIVGYALSWALTCGIIYLITLCFGWEFSWLIATGIWLIIILLNWAFKSK